MWTDISLDYTPGFNVITRTHIKERMSLESERAVCVRGRGKEIWMCYPGGSEGREESVSPGKDVASRNY